MIQLYHPNKSNSGYAASFNVSEDSSCVYATLIRQFGWDAVKGNGTFKGNKDSIDNRVNIKLSFVEVSAILDTIDRKRVFSAYHDADKPKQIKFDVWVDKNSGNDRGFTFSINVSDKQNSEYKNSFYFGFTYAEARYVREYLIFCLQSSFKKELSSRTVRKEPVQVQKPFVTIAPAISKNPPANPHHEDTIDNLAVNSDDNLIGDL